MEPVCRTLVHACAVHYESGHMGRARIWMAVLLSLVALASCRSDQVATADCRQQFAHERQSLAQDGNPGSKDFTPKLTARWDALYSEFGRLGKTATSEDCPDRLARTKAQVRRVESVLHKLDDYDVARMTREAEADFKHAEELRGAGPRDYVLITTFRTLQESGADAQKSLASYVAAVDSVDPDKYSALAPAMVALYNVASSDAAFADFKDARDTIKNYEPPKQ
jgi:hypothetical protein